MSLTLNEAIKKRHHIQFDTGWLVFIESDEKKIIRVNFLPHMHAHTHITIKPIGLRQTSRQEDGSNVNVEARHTDGQAEKLASVLKGGDFFPLLRGLEV